MNTQWMAVLMAMGVVRAAPALSAGDPAPAFEVESTGGKVRLSDFKGKWLVLYFYPKSFTPGCTKQSCSLRDGMEALGALNAVVLGASVDDIETQKKFKAEYNLPFELIADDEKLVSKAYNVLSPLGIFAVRRTFIVSPAGRIAHVFESVSTGTHADDVKTELERLQAKP